MLIWVVARRQLALVGEFLKLRNQRLFVTAETGQPDHLLALTFNAWLGPHQRDVSNARI
jgi:hypothetical protein